MTWNSVWTLNGDRILSTDISNSPSFLQQDDDLVHHVLDIGIYGICFEIYGCCFVIYGCVV